MVEQEQTQDIVTKVFTTIQHASRLSQAAEKALKRGIRQGRAEGSYKAKVETAKKLLAKGFSDTEIQELTGLSEQEILAL